MLLDRYGTGQHQEHSRTEEKKNDQRYGIRGKDPSGTMAKSPWIAPGS